MKLTLSIDDRILEKARRRANEMGTTVNQIVRQHLLDLVSERDVEAEIAAFDSLCGKAQPGNWKWNREDLYQERLDGHGRRFDDLQILNPFL